MKHTMKVIKSLLMSLLIMTFVFLFVKCEKDSQSSVSSVMTSISKEDNMSKYLKQFKKTMQLASKDSQTLTLDDARWHLEAVLNYTYGDAGYETSIISRDTIDCTMLISNGEVSLHQLNKTFETLCKDVDKVSKDCNLLMKSVLAIQTNFTNTSKDGNVHIQTIVTMRGYSSSLTPIMFGETDYWWSYNTMGKCGPYVGECIGRGAITELTSRATMLLPHYSCGDGYRTYFVDYEYEHVDPIQNELYDENSPCGNMLYMQPGSIACLSPDEMNYYLSKSMYIVDLFKPEGKVPIWLQYGSGLMTSVDNRSLVVHYLDLIYASLHCEYVGVDQ